jgi:predicted transcriptional regulator
VIKDFTSLISMSREMRNQVLSALREVYDGRWERNVGVDGGRTLTWEGRLVVIGASTTAYDTANSVIAAMGDRFAVVRIDSTKNRVESGRSALKNVSREKAMRQELADAVKGLLADINTDLEVLADDTMDVLLNAADLVTLARTAVERDIHGNVIDAHAPEMPTRFAKMLGQIARGALALGMRTETALGLALRVARDSIPPLRLDVLRDVAKHPDAQTSEIATRVGRPRTTVKRVLDELLTLGLVDQFGWHYVLAEKVSLDVLDVATANLTSPEKSVQGDRGNRKEEAEAPERKASHPVTDKSGDDALVAVMADALTGSGPLAMRELAAQVGVDHTTLRPVLGDLDTGPFRIDADGRVALRGSDIPAHNPREDRP